jgi:hypothetical protein
MLLNDQQKHPIGQDRLMDSGHLSAASFFRAWLRGCRRKVCINFVLSQMTRRHFGREFRVFTPPVYLR